VSLICIMKCDDIVGMLYYAVIESNIFSGLFYWEPLDDNHKNKSYFTLIIVNSW